MQKIFAAMMLLCTSLHSHAQQDIPLLSVYFQWGYNRDVYSRSDVHFRNGESYDFIVHDMQAKDQPDFTGFVTDPLDITIPQNSCRLGMYINETHTRAIELNFDHAKYVMRDNQTLKITGHIYEAELNADTLVTHNFLHMEHTNGANFLMVNYVGLKELFRRKNCHLGVIWKAGAGVVIPKTDVTFMGNRLDNKFHVAGYITGVEGGVRFYPIKNLYLETSFKGGFANYLNALAIDGGKMSHHFFYGEYLLFLGYDFNFGKKKAVGSHD